MSPSETTRNKQFSRLSYANNGFPIKPLMQQPLKPTILENVGGPQANNTITKDAPAGLSEAADDYGKETKASQGFTKLNESNSLMGAQEQPDVPQESLDSILKFEPKPENNNVIQDGFVKEYGTTKMANGNVKLDSAKIALDNLVGNGSITNGFSLNNNYIGIDNNRSVSIANSLNGSADVTSTRRFSVRRTSQLGEANEPPQSEKISDIYVNRNISGLYPNANGIVEPDRVSIRTNATIENHSKGFFLHGSRSNSQNPIVGGDSIYQGYMKQREQTRNILDRRPSYEDGSEYLSKLLNSSAVRQPKPREVNKRPSINLETWESFEEDELTSILG